MTDLRPEAQKQAEAAYDGFILWSKRTTYASIAFLFIVASCNFGVEDNTYPGYNGEQYSPTGLSVKK
jgi:hypothetical protein